MTKGHLWPGVCGCVELYVDGLVGSNNHSWIVQSVHVESFTGANVFIGDHPNRNSPEASITAQIPLQMLSFVKSSFFETFLGLYNPLYFN